MRQDHQQQQAHRGQHPDDLTAYLDRADKPHFAALVPNDKIAEQDYNLSVSTYVEQEDTREVIDIQKLNAEIAQIVAREQQLREEIDKIVAEIEDGEYK